MLNLDISKKADKFIDSLPDKIQKQISSKIQDLRTNSQPSDSVKLKGSDYRRVSSGEYRIIYKVENLVLLVIVLVGKRNDSEIYKKLKRQG